jgi:hypothetical protein
MRIRGDIESVNLSTGERFERISGDGESRLCSVWDRRYGPHPCYGAPVIGILYDATAGNDYCNGKIAITAPNDPCPNLKECLHLDDVLKALPPEVPDSSKST